MDINNGERLSSQGTVERQEAERHNKAAFLGGIFSAGGRMAFNIENQTKLVAGVERLYKYGYPFISLTDKSQSKMAKLKDMFGGKIRPARDTINSIVWYIKSDDAVGFAQTLHGFCPSREEVITAFENWANANVEEKLEIAKDFKAIDSLSPDAYQELIKNPQFLAGVLTARGGLHSSFHRQKLKKPVLTFNTTNKILVDAIKRKYGGGIAHRGGSSNGFSFGEETTSKILDLVRNHLIVPLEDLPDEA